MEAPADKNQVVASDGAGVAATQVTTCQWRPNDSGWWLEDYQCTQPLDSAHPSLCILHDPAQNKDLAVFNRALRQKIVQGEADDNIRAINLAGVVFPADTDFGDPIFKKAVTFAEAHFDGEAHFGGAQFGEAAVFQDAQFGGQADFVHAQFVGNAYFEGTRFGGEARFINAQFGGAAHFWSARFGGGAGFAGARFSGAAYFIWTSFPPKDSEAVIYFTQLPPESVHQVRLEGVDLARVSFRFTDVSQIQFVGCTWAQKAGRLLWPLPLPRPSHHRTVIYDEVVLDRDRVESERRQVALLYRQLRLNFEASRQEAEAGDFYVGQMEMRRQDPSYPWLYRWMLAAYRVLALYGESYLRPPFFYFLFGAVFALAYLWGGFQVGQAPVKYDPISFAWGQAGAFFKDSVRAYVQALTAGGLLGANLFGGQMGASLETTAWWVPAVRYVNMLLDTFLVGFFVIALRRHFHR